MATIKDVARIAGVSVSTVSHVVNGTRYVSPEKVRKVEDAIRQLDELPNFIAKRSALKSKLSESRYVLILLSKKRSLFQNQVKEKLEEIVEQKGYIAISLAYDLDEDRLAAIRALAGTLDLAGMVAFPDREGVLSGAFFKGLRFPVVLIGNPVDRFAADTLLPDTFEGSYRAVRHLIKNGHERIAYLCESEACGTQRFEGYRKALEDSGIALEKVLVRAGLKTEALAAEAMAQIVATEPAPTAVVIADSLPLIPAIRYGIGHNIAVPGDLSVVSLNDPEWASLTTPELTCVDKQPRQFALSAADLLFRRIDRGEIANLSSPAHAYCTKTLPSILNVRNSTCGIGRGPFGERAAGAGGLALSEVEKEKIRQKQYTAAISFHYMGKAWMRLQEKGIKKVFDELGISIIAVTDAHFNATLQCKQLESIKFLKPDLLISIPVDTRGTAEAFRSIADSDTRLVLITNVPEGLTPKDYISCISVNERAHGDSMGRGLGEYMVRHGLKYAGLICHGEQNFFATKQRDGAAEQVLTEEYPEIRVCGKVNFLTEVDVYQKTLKLIGMYPEIQALYVSWDGPALEVIKALTELERTDIAIVTGDLDYAIAMQMAQGGMVKMISAQCPYEQGEAIAMVAANGLLGKAVPSFIGVEPISIDRENLLKNWKAIFKEDPPAALRNAINLSTGAL